MNLFDLKSVASLETRNIALESLFKVLFLPSLVGWESNGTTASIPNLVSCSVDLLRNFKAVYSSKYSIKRRLNLLEISPINGQDQPIGVNADET